LATLWIFLLALSLVVVCQRSLAAQELKEAGDEDEALGAITMLRVVYNELDILDAPFARKRSSRRSHLR
jgi:hypothetical protein